MADAESLLREAYMDTTSIRLARRPSRQMTRSERLYSAYGDEPLTSTSDSLEMTSWSLRH